MCSQWLAERCTCCISCLQIRYPASLPTLPMGVSGAHFVAIAGTNQSSLEALLLKRGLRGPGWCLLTGATRKEGTQQVRPGPVSAFLFTTPDTCGRAFSCGRTAGTGALSTMC